MSPLYVWAAVGVAGLAYAIREEFRYRRETKQRVAGHTKDAIDANRARWPAHGRIVYVPPGHASMIRDIVPLKHVVYHVPKAAGSDHKWRLIMTDATGRRTDTGRAFSRRSTALRACRQASAREAIKHRKG